MILFIKNFLNKIPKKPLFAIIPIIVLSLISYFSKKGHKKRDVVSASIDDDTANSYADQFQQAMGDTGTDEHAIFSLLENIKTEQNYNKVYNAFATRPYIPTFGVYDEFFGNHHNLTIWLTSELGKHDQQKINELYPFVFN
jgi:hypothetical protein